MLKWEIDENDQLVPVYYHPNGMRQSVVWAPQPGSQEAYLQCDVYEVLYHGNRGPGKTDAMLMDFAQEVGKGWGQEWRGIIFRRTYPELEDIIQKSLKWFPLIFPDATYNRTSHVWTFKDGENIRFRHFAKPADYNSYHGHAYCLWEGEGVSTPCGVVPIGQLKEGDLVNTPSGPRSVRRVFDTGTKACLRVSHYDSDWNLISELYQSEDHRLLTSEGWQRLQRSQTSCIYLPRAELSQYEGFGGHNHHYPHAWLPNPYDRQPVATSHGIRHGYVVSEPCGDLRTVDIEVDETNCYYSSSGLIMSNCFIGWEEITNWPDNKSYLSMHSCCRSPIKGIPLKYRATTNPYGVGHCVDEGEVLTPDGWKDICNVNVGDTVYSVDPSGSLVMDTVAQVHKAWYEGDIIRRDARGLYMSFTPNHSLPKITPNGFDLVPFSKLPGQTDILRQVSWAGNQLEWFTIPEIECRATRLNQPKSIRGEDLAELLGWFVSEGYTLDRDKEFGIAQCKENNRRIIKALLDRCGFHYRTTDTAFIVSSPHWWSWLRQFDGKCRNKRLPSWFLQSDAVYLKCFFDAAMLGDGSGNIYYTMSKVLADQMSEVGLKLGYSVYLTSRYRHDRNGLTYQVNFKKTKSGGVQLVTGNHIYSVPTECRSVNVSRKPFSGVVYCLGVPKHHTFIIRQKGCVWISGNSWVKKRWKLPVPRGRAIGPILRDPPTKDIPEPKPRISIQGSLSENKILLHADPDYINNIAASTNNEAQLKAWLYCDWNVVAGGMFSDLWDDRYHVLPHIPFDKIPKRWRWNRAYDHGQSKPFSVGWYVESNGEPLELGDYIIGPIKGDVIRIAEWYGCGKDDNTGLNMLNSQIAQGILDREDDWGIRGKVRPGPADSAIFSRTQAQESVAKDMEKIGVRWESVDKAPGSRIQGWQRMREFLSGAVPVDGYREEPGLFFTERCSAALRLIPTAPRDEKNMDDLNTDSEDHVCDETRYRLWHTRKQAKQRKF